MNDETKPNQPTEEQVTDAHAAFYLDIINRMFAGKNLAVIMTVFGSFLYNVSKEVSPGARSFITENMVKIANDILAIDNQSQDNSQTSLNLND